MKRADIPNAKKRMLEALEKSLGIVTTAAEHVGISRDTHYSWLKKDAKYAAAVSALDNKALDYVESKLFEKITGITIQERTSRGAPIYAVPPSDAAIIFYLKTKGKARGYIERTDHTIASKDDSEKTEYVLPDGSVIKM